MAYRILIIDDDAALLKMLQKYLEMQKYEIITAENGAEGMEKLKFQPDIILLDINMPRIDGIEVCRMIRDKVTCPVIFLTARVEEQDVVNGLSSGGDDYILKPFRLKELEARIAAHLKREGRQRERTECCFQGELTVDYKAKTVQINTDYALNTANNILYNPITKSRLEFTNKTRNKSFTKYHTTHNGIPTI